ncbi:V-type ATP synthase subunit I [Intestinimonas massiliensis]|uniref:V-type ATP synthase subunit I n=1 Tax=Intestinimonas massiliensis (ex Afouda et al. 2020) TaxID=1673721 RepID=A0ABS9M7L9_9FIRM|nr:V-type ATP synthase subunit I [Intestinimonas massiliensis (ex Afouda et al. 2020)]MCG4526775.1 V-type ATP synthase subunit I [Intestinimonas massiliensis (ex Afouda et al. 2020)]MCQ4807709.1 V-type ATP synthase subunit I [Intestinimonas massiliensis (ex Afouda et al. 2020)]
MSIVKMKHIRLFGMAADRETLLRQLQHLGCVEISEPTDKLADPDWAALTRVDDAGLARVKADAALLNAALNTLKGIGKEKGGLLQARPEVTEGQLFDEGLRASAMEAAQAVNAQEKRISAIQNEQGKLRAQKAALTPWLELDIPLETTGTREVSATFGAVMSTVALDTVKQALEEATELVEVIPAGKDREFQYVLILCHRSAEETAFETLKKFGFSRSSLRGWTGTARENTDRLEGELRRLEGELAEAKGAIAALVPHREDIKLCIDRMTQEIQREEYKGRLLQSQATIFFEGWVPAENLPALEKVLGQYPAAWEANDPAPEEYPQVPIKLKNNKLTRPLNMVTNMYVLPAYDGVDPNPLMAPFFIFFFGLMMADMGYGILMVAAALVVIYKMKPKDGMADFAGLLLLCGISTFLMGALTGGFFGDFIPQLAKIINPASTLALPALFTPLNDTLAILIGSLVLGLIQIITGMIISVVRKVQAGDVADAIWSEVTWWIILGGAALAILGIGSVGGYPVVLIVGLVMLVIGSTRNAKGFGKLTALIGAVYNGATGFFSDILSYARLMALMLAGSVIAQVFNTLGSVTGNVVGFVIISFIGNMLNFALNLLGCYVHDLRLQCLEFFGRFYKEGGKPFRPLFIHTKYVDIKEE